MIFFFVLVSSHQTDTRRPLVPRCFSKRPHPPLEVALAPRQARATTTPPPPPPTPAHLRTILHPLIPRIPQQPHQTPSCQETCFTCKAATVRRMITSVAATTKKWAVWTGATCWALPPRDRGPMGRQTQTRAWRHPGGINSRFLETSSRAAPAQGCCRPLDQQTTHSKGGRASVSSNALHYRAPVYEHSREAFRTLYCTSLYKSVRPTYSARVLWRGELYKPKWSKNWSTNLQTVLFYSFPPPLNNDKNITFCTKPVGYGCDLAINNLNDARKIRNHLTWNRPPVFPCTEFSKWELTKFHTNVCTKLIKSPPVILPCSVDYLRGSRNRKSLFEIIFVFCECESYLANGWHLCCSTQLLLWEKENRGLTLSGIGFLDRVVPHYDQLRLLGPRKIIKKQTFIRFCHG